MKTKLFLALSLVFAVGCKDDPVDEFLSGASSWKSKMCACKDKACTEKVHEDFKKWEDQMESKLKGIDKDSVDKSKVEKIIAAEKDYRACRRKHDEP